MKKEALIRVRDSINQISKAIVDRTEEMNADVISMRNDPKIVKLWNRLCVLHMSAVVMCDGLDDPICQEVLAPQVCITRLHLSEEMTCCTRLFKRLRENVD